MRTLLLFHLLLYASPVFGQTGTISGMIALPKKSVAKRIAVEKYTGKISGKVARPPSPTAGVWLTRKGLKSPASPKPQVLPQENYQFDTSLLVIPKGTEVTFPNRDADYHNVYSLSRTERFDLGRYKKNENPIPKVTFDRAGLVELRCEIHEHMQARVLVVDTPYFAATDNNGAFKLSKIPPGTYTLHAQFDKKHRWSRTLTVKANVTTKVSFP